MNKLKILFIAPSHPESTLLTPDLGVGFLATAIREVGYSPDFIDMKRDDLTDEQVVNRAVKGGYDVIGLKCFSHYVPYIARLAKKIRAAMPEVRLILGGAHPTFAYEDALKAVPDADLALIGEAEISLPELLNAWETDKPITGINSIIYWDENREIVINPKADFIDPKDFPKIPAWDLIDPRKYQQFEGLWPCNKGKVVSTISVSRGCPFKCTFCVDFISSGRKVRYRPLENVIEEIKLLQREYGVDEIQIVDSLFTLNRNYAYDFSQALIDNNIKIHWATPYGIRLDSLDKELLIKMNEAGLYGVSVGIESGNDRVLAFMQKGIDKKKIREKVQLIKDSVDVILQGTFITGYPTDDAESMQETIDFACDLPLDIAAFIPFRPTPGTAIETYLKENEPEIFASWSSQTMEKITYSPKGITPEEVQEWSRKAYRQFFFRPRIMIKYMATLTNRSNMLFMLGRIKRRLFRTFTKVESAE